MLNLTVTDEELGILLGALQARDDFQEGVIKRISDSCKADPLNPKTPRLLTQAINRCDATHSLLIKLSR
jgi:hypothetical protein